MRQLGLSIILGLSLLRGVGTAANSVRISFLGDEFARNDTCAVLTNAGCSGKAADALRRAGFDYFAKGFDIDLTKFPKPQKGFYSFPNIESLTQALPAKAFQSEHPVSLNCFDTVILLAQGQLQCSLVPDEIAGPFLVPILNTNIEPAAFVPSGAATPRDAFSQLYSWRGKDETAGVIDASLRDSWICLSASLYQCHVLPTSVTTNTVKERGMEVLRLSWLRNGIQFPKRCELIQIHGVRNAGLCTEHAGLLFRRPEGYSYIEKNGVHGPFVRLDCASKAELSRWLATIWRSCELHDQHLWTVNDTEIKELDRK